MKFWSDLSKLTGTTLKTLGRGNAFDVVEVNEKQVIVKPHATGAGRAINRKDFQNAFDAICVHRTIDLAGIRRFSEMNPVYVAAMIAALPYISYTNEPKISLKLIQDLSA